MLNRLLLFFEYPPAVRIALGFLLGGWLSIAAFIAHIEWSFPGRFTQATVLRMLVVGLGICYCVFRIKPWARKLCIFFNVGIIGINLFFLIIRLSALGITSPALSAHALLNVILFGCSTYYLMIDETTRFFKEREPIKIDNPVFKKQEPEKVDETAKELNP